MKKKKTQMQNASFWQWIFCTCRCADHSNFPEQKSGGFMILDTQLKSNGYFHILEILPSKAATLSMVSCHIFSETVCESNLNSCSFIEFSWTSVLREDCVWISMNFSKMNVLKSKLILKHSVINGTFTNCLPSLYCFLSNWASSQICFWIL